MMEGEGAQSAPTPSIFICENNRKSNKIMHCVDFFLSGGCEDRVILSAFLCM